VASAIPLITFFTHYAALSLNGQSAELAALYAPTFIVAGPQGSQAFHNDQRFLDWLDQVTAFNREHGMRALDVVTIQDEMLGLRHTLTTVTWGAQFERSGDRSIEFDISYLLEETRDSWRVLAYISHNDQTEEMRKHGLL